MVLYLIILCCLYSMIVEKFAYFLSFELKEFLARVINCTLFRDIMWKYYEKEKNYSAAARILAKLADRDREGDSFSLWDRIDYISRAILCAKACTTSLNNEVRSRRSALFFIFAICFGKFNRNVSFT